MSPQKQQTGLPRPAQSRRALKTGDTRSRYIIRFTPRKPTSNWSSVNIKRVNELIAIGQMKPAGLAAFQARKQEKSGVYSYENRPRQLSAEFEQQFRANKKAWEFFQAQAHYYQRTACAWVMTAKKEETRLKRLATLIEDSAQGRRIAAMGRTANKKRTRAHEGQA